MSPQPIAMDSSFKRISTMRYMLYIALCVAAVYWTLSGSILLHSVCTRAKQHERGLDLVSSSDLASTGFDQRHRSSHNVIFCGRRAAINDRSRPHLFSSIPRRLYRGPSASHLSHSPPAWISFIHNQLWRLSPQPVVNPY